MLRNTEVAPTPNARRSVTDVMVIDIPLVLSMLFILSSIDAFNRDGAPAIPDININMSSMPIAEKHTILYITIHVCMQKRLVK